MNNKIKEKPIPDNTIEIDVNKLKTLKIKLNKIFKEKDDWFIEYYDIKEILEQSLDYEFDLTFKQKRQLLDYITNLEKENKMLKQNVKDTYDTSQELLVETQDKVNNQTEEINRLYKQRDKFMKKYGYLKEENKQLKDLCNKYEEEHKTTFEEWKNGISKYKTLKDLQERIDKAVEHIEKIKILNEEDRHATMKWEYDIMFPDLLNILNGDDE